MGKMDAQKKRIGFKLPFKDDSNVNFGNNQICVVAIIGKSSLTTHPCKAVCINDILKRSIFQEPQKIGETSGDDVKNMCSLEGHYDIENNVIYLHLMGVYDSHYLISLCKEINDLQSKGFLHSWADMKVNYAKALLLIFSISHIVLVVHPTPAFDVSYVHLFRTLDIVRQKSLAMMTEVLKKLGVSSDWAQFGRLCSPRVLFLMRRHCHEVGYDFTGSSSKSKTFTSSKLTPTKKLEHALEDQIYRILRKSRVITNISLNSLFAIPANQEFVFVDTYNENNSDIIGHLLNNLQIQCGNITSEDKTNAVSGHGPSGHRIQFNSNEHTFKSFLEQHIQLALHKGFDDNAGRHSGPNLFERPSAATWLKVANRLHEFLLNEDGKLDSDSKSGGNVFKNYVDTEGRFSEGRCAKVLPIASATYQENLPPHYSADYHQSKLLQAIIVFSQHARGPAFERYVKQLQDECNRLWQNGRQACEIYSVTGNRCLNALHKLPSDNSKIEEDDTVNASSLPVMEHNSQMKLLAACNCGRKQTSRDDPFTVKSANYDFYKQVMHDCCESLHRIKFPVFQPSTRDFKAARVTTALAEKDANSMDSLWKSSLIARHESMSSSSISLGQSGPGEDPSIEPNSPPQDLDCVKPEDATVIVQDIETTDATKEKALARQPSTTEYLPGMTHSNSPPGLLPTFASWSLVCLGPSSLYSHNVGIQDQPGFISGTNFLLPWDVTVKSLAPPEKETSKNHQETESWPSVGEIGVKKPTPNKAVRKSVRDYSEFTVKIFLGVEYECPCGHRFMCSEPDKLLKATGNGLVKENAAKVTSSDMPLYFPCPCRSGKSQAAQLMRVHVVTPKAPVHVTLDPRVQPSQGTCPMFSPGLQEPVKLTQSAYWVLRLPFVYEGDTGAYLPPTDGNILSCGRLLKGMYSVIPIAGER